MDGWKQLYEQLFGLKIVSPLEPAKLVELATCAY